VRNAAAHPAAPRPRTGTCLRALLLTGDDEDRDTARRALTDTALAGLARRRRPTTTHPHERVRHGELRRLAFALREASRALKANRAQMLELLHVIAPGLTDRPGAGPVSAAQTVVSFSHPGRVRNDAEHSTGPYTPSP